MLRSTTTPTMPQRVSFVRDTLRVYADEIRWIRVRLDCLAERTSLSSLRALFADEARYLNLFRALWPHRTDASAVRITHDSAVRTPLHTVLNAQKGN